MLVLAGAASRGRPGPEELGAAAVAVAVVDVAGAEVVCMAENSSSMSESYIS